MIDLRDNDGKDVDTTNVSSSINDITDRINEIENERTLLQEEKKKVTINVGDKYLIKSCNRYVNVVILRIFQISNYNHENDKTSFSSALEYIHRTNDESNDLHVNISTSDVEEFKKKIKRFNGNIDIVNILNLKKET